MKSLVFKRKRKETMWSCHAIYAPFDMQCVSENGQKNKGKMGRI